MFQEQLSKQILHFEKNEKRPLRRPQTRWLDYIEDLGWNRLELRPSEMQSVLLDREVWQFKRFTRNLPGKASEERKRQNLIRFCYVRKLKKNSNEIEIAETKQLIMIS